MEVTESEGRNEYSPYLRDKIFILHRHTEAVQVLKVFKGDVREVLRSASPIIWAAYDLSSWSSFFQDYLINVLAERIISV